MAASIKKTASGKPARRVRASSLGIQYLMNKYTFPKVSSESAGRLIFIHNAFPNGLLVLVFF
jgi:hypothetical protein